METRKGDLYVVSSDNIPSISFLNTASCHAGFYFTLPIIKTSILSTDFLQAKGDGSS